jgi:hypothetical protein
VNAEEWRPIPGHEDNYMVSTEGRIKSRRREGARGGLLKLPLGGHGYLQVNLFRDGEPVKCRVHQLVALTFLGPRPDGMQVRHLDGDRTNSRLANLAYGTLSENMQDMIKHGNNARVNKTHCPQGHPYEEANLYPTTNGRRNRRCRECGRARDRARTAAKTAARRAARVAA